MDYLYTTVFFFFCETKVPEQQNWYWSEYMNDTSIIHKYDFVYSHVRTIRLLHITYNTCVVQYNAYTTQGGEETKRLRLFWVQNINIWDVCYSIERCSFECLKLIRFWKTYSRAVCLRLKWSSRNQCIYW